MLGSWPLHSIFNICKYIVIVGFTDWLDIYMYLHFFLTSNGIACHATMSGANQIERVIILTEIRFIRLMRIGEYHQNVRDVQSQKLLSYYHMCTVIT